MKDKRKAYEERIDAQLKEWSAQIALLKAKADHAKADARRSDPPTANCEAKTN